MSLDLDKLRADVEAKLDPEWVAAHGDWSYAAALALIGETSPQTGPEPTPQQFLASARVVGSVDGRPTRARGQRLLAQLARMRSRLGRQLLAGAEVAYAEAVRRAGIKVATRARSRGASAATRLAATAAVAMGGPYGSLLGALGLREQDLLAGAFLSYEAQAQAWINEYRQRVRTAIEAAGLDPDDYMPEDLEADVLAATFLTAGLVALARQRVLSGVEGHVLGPNGMPALPGEVTGSVPARLVRDAIGVAERTLHPTHGATLDELPSADRLPSASSVEGGIADYLAGEGTATWTWVHGFYGDPLSPFEPHELLGASEFTTADTETDPDLANGDSFPDGDYYQPDDHDGCTCEWVANLPGE